MKIPDKTHNKLPVSKTILFSPLLVLPQTPRKIPALIRSYPPIKNDWKWESKFVFFQSLLSLFLCLRLSEESAEENTSNLPFKVE